MSDAELLYPVIADELKFTPTETFALALLFAYISNFVITPGIAVLL